MGDDRSARRRPHHDRRDQIAGAGRIIVEQAQHVALAELEAEFLVQFAQRRLRRRLAVVAAAARQRPLRAVGAQARGAPGQQQRRSAGRVSASVSAMATAARFSAGAASLAGSRANAAQSSAIFRRVASSNGLVIPLDYNTSRD